MFHENDTFTRSFVVTDDLYRGFIELFDDRNPLHVDEAFARARGFQGKVMHGNILGGFLSYFVGECLPTRNVIIHSQEILYKAPVYLNDALSFEAVVDGVHESVGAVEFRFRFRNAEGATVSKGKMQIGLLS